MKIAVVGSGGAGVVAAWALSSKHEVVLYEKEARLGGHINTFRTDFYGESISVDTGFVVFNYATYPVLSALLDLLDLETKPGRMTLSLTGGNAFAFGTNIKQTFLANKIKALDPRLLFLAINIARFNRRANKDLQNGTVPDCTIFEYLKQRGFNERFFDNYLGPLAGAVWIGTPDSISGIPARSFLQFFDHHRLLEFSGHKWRTICGGASNYVDKLVEQFPDSVRTGCAANQVTRSDKGVTVTDSHGDTETYDHVVMACHADEALALLTNSTPLETELLGTFKSKKNFAICHGDPRLMPERRELWASWNCIYASDGSDSRTNMSVTYFLNLIHQIDQSKPVFITVNPHFEPRPDLRFLDIETTHVQFDKATIDAQNRLGEIQGQDRIWYAGSYWGYGFHEDAVGSGLAAARSLGCEIPELPAWNQPRW